MEFTRHPFWILKMLSEAVDWFEAEDEYKLLALLDRSTERIIATRKKFPRLSQMKIGEMVGVSKQRVSFVLKQYGK
jgi:DNA-directed RNA polymerase specialized sigma subunit